MQQNPIMHIILTLTLSCIMATCLLCQDVESIAEKISEGDVGVSGIINVDGGYYTSNGIQRSLPYFARANAFLNVDLFGMSVPFSASFGTGGELFGHELPSFGFVGISPFYKDVTLHLGDRSLDFSKYSFSGHSFRGVGFEYKPDSWFVKAFYGRLQRAQAEDLVSIHQLNPVYKRMGWGISSGFESDKASCALSLFRAKDVDDGLVQVDSTFNFFAGENAILSLKGQYKLSKALTLKSEVAYSGYTENVNEEVDVEANVARSFGNILDTNLSSRWNFAFNTQVNLKTKIGRLQAGYERIDPGYRTFGSLFFQDDLQQLHFGLITSFFQKKLTLNSKVGFRNNNLNGDQANSYNRFIGSVNVNYIPTQRINFTAMYSTFNNVNKKSFVLDPVSPVLFTTYALDNKSYAFSSSYKFVMEKERQQLLRLTANHNRGLAIQNDQVDVNTEIVSYGLRLVYSVINKTKGLSFSIFQNNRWTQFAAGNTNINGVGASVSRLFNEEQTTVAGTLSFNLTERNASKGTLFNTTLGVNHKFTEMLTIGLMNTLISSNQEASATDLLEYRINANLKYTF